MFKFAKDEKGAVAILLVLSITAIIIICSFVLDFGMVFYNSVRLQNALDASLLAAGQQLPVGKNNKTKKDQIIDTIHSYLEKNYMVDLSTLNIEFIHLNDNYYNGIRARMSINTKYNFAKILGKESIDVVKQAEVRILPVVRLAGVSPLGVKKDKLDEFLSSGQFTGITLKYGGGGGTGGDFGAIDLDGVKGGGADDFERWLTYGYTMELGINEGLLPIEPGNMAGPTTMAINRRYTSCTHFPSDGGCNYQHYEPTCQRVLKVPIVVEANKKNVVIVAFAAFVIEEPADESNGTVKGSFISIIGPGAPAETEEDINNANYGIYSLRLSQ